MSENYVLFELTIARGFAYLAGLAQTDPWGGLEMRGKGYVQREIDERLGGEN